MICNILTIAGTDCTGGAGIQADMKAISANKGYAMSVITAVVAQNTQGVKQFNIMPTELIRAQIDAVFEDVKVDAIKIGMLGSAEVIECIAQAIDDYKPAKIVLDPVMVAKSGDNLIDDKAITALKDKLIPKVGLITPNLPEAARLLDVSEATTRADMISQAKQFVVPTYIKGGHLQGNDESPDLLRIEDSYQWFESERIATKNNHGTGCTLSAAIATYWGQGDNLDTACEKAKKYLTGALSNADALNVGKGHGPLHHFYQYY